MPGRVHTDMAAVAAIEPDAELMLRVKTGDSASFALLLERYRAPVNHFLYRMVQNQAVAEELAQDVFLRVFRARASYEPSARFTTWLFRIASNVALNHLRDCKAEPDSADLECDIPDRKPSVEQRLVGQSRLVEIRRAIWSLPGKQRAAVMMHKYHEMEYSEIAKVLGSSESAVKSLLFRAYETLRDKLAGMVSSGGAHGMPGSER